MIIVQPGSQRPPASKAATERQPGETRQAFALRLFEKTHDTTLVAVRMNITEAHVHQMVFKERQRVSRERAATCVDARGHDLRPQPRLSAIEGKAEQITLVVCWDCQRCDYTVSRSLRLTAEAVGRALLEGIEKSEAAR